MKINAISDEFPLVSLYSNKSPIKGKKEKPGLKLFNDIKNGYNNESPDFFRIDSMKENRSAYKNPFLDNSFSLDRRSFFKELDITKRNILFIDKIKSKREYSQNANVIKSISSSHEMDLNNKRKMIEIYEDKNLAKNRYTLDENNNKELYDKKIKTIHYQYSPKLNYHFKKKIDPQNSNLKPALSLEFFPKQSSFLRNLNGYSIKESQRLDNDKLLNFISKETDYYNCITDTKSKIKSHNITVDKWSPFYEKYLNIKLVI
jgi:hypothetical protein